MNDMRKYINLVESMDDIIPGERPKYNTLAKQLAAVQKYGDAIQYIKDPSEVVQLASVSQYGYAIKFIDNPSEEVQLAAVQKNRFAIKYIPNPSINVQLEAVKQHGRDHPNNPGHQLHPHPDDFNSLRGDYDEL